MSQKVLESEFLKLRDISQLRDISSKKRKWDGLLIGVSTVYNVIIQGKITISWTENRINRNS